MDTVPPHIPLCETPDIIYGRGYCDDKGPMASQITAVEELRKQGLIEPEDISLFSWSEKNKVVPARWLPMT